MPHPSPTQRAFVRSLQLGIQDLRPLLSRLRRALLEVARHDGAEALRQHFDRLYVEHFARPRLKILTRVARHVAETRVTTLRTQAHQHYSNREWSTAPVVPQIVERVLSQPIGRLSWRFTDCTWPRDRWIRDKFFSVLDDAQRRRERLRQRALSASTDIEAREGEPPPKHPHIDPTLRKFAYPIDPDLSDVDLIERAADTVVVARGEYFAAVGMQTAMRAADSAARQIMRGEIPQIIAWQWELSPAHPRPDRCDDYASADLTGLGPGIYFDAAMPEDHANGLCGWIAVWANPSDVEDPDWEPPEPDDDYVARVEALIQSVEGGGRMHGSAARTDPVMAGNWSDCCGAADWRAAFKAEFGAEVEPRLSEAWGRQLAQAIRCYVPEPMRVAEKIRLAPTMGAVHGEWDDETKTIRLNPAIWLSRESFGTAGHRIDRLTHTAIHEYGHAWGNTHGYDETREWLTLSGWLHSPHLTPPGYQRYVEKRVGWSREKQEWVHSQDAWFVRYYSSKSPFEDFADCCLYVLAGWGEKFDNGGEGKRAYVLRCLAHDGVTLRRAA